MKVTCSGCGRTLNVPDKAVGKTVACPACKTKVKVEETFSLMPEKPPGYEIGAREAGGPPGPEAGPSVTDQGPEGLPRAKTCPNCGFLLLPDADHCSRCGTDLATGERREELRGYQPGLKTRMFGKTGWILTLAVTAVIVVAVVVVVGLVRGFAEKVVEEETKGERERGVGMPRLDSGEADLTEPGRKPGRKPAKKSKKLAAPGKEDIAVTFRNAFGYLVNPSPSAQEDGLRRIADMGAKVVPLIRDELGRRTAGSGEEDARAAKMLARVLGRIPETGSSALLVGLLTDTDAGVRAEALGALAAHGKVAKDALTAALGSDAAATRAAAARAARRLQFPEHTPILIALLADGAAEVSVGAARALSRRIGTPDIYDALVEATARGGSLDVAAAASEALAKHKDALDTVLKALTAKGTSTEALHSPQTFFLAVPVVAWKAPAGIDVLATYLGGGVSSSDVLDYIKKFLNVRSPITRVESLKEARHKGLGEPRMVVAASVCLADTNGFVARSALRYVSSVGGDGGEVGFPAPLVVMLGHTDVEFAMDVARALVGRGGEAPPGLTAALGHAVGGVLPRRRVMAAGVLARRGDDRGAALLREAAAGAMGLAPPLSGWAAYQYSFLEKGEGGSEFARAAENMAKSSSSNLDRAYYAAAAARLGSGDMLAHLRRQLGHSSKGVHARLVVGLLGELKDAGAKDALIYQLHRNDPQLVAAVVRSLRTLGDASVVTAIVERIPRVKPETVATLRDAVRSFGAEAEPHLLELLEHKSPLVRRAATDCLVDRGREVSKEVARNLVEILQDATAKKDLHEGIPKVLAALSGTRAKKEEWEKWHWRKWAEVCRVKVKDLSERFEYKRIKRDWLSMEVPEKWRAYAGSASSPRAVGKPEVAMRTSSEPAKKSKSRQRYKDERDYRKKRKAQIALLSRGDRRSRPKIKPGLTVIDEGRFHVGRGKIAGMRLVDEKRGRTSYYLFLFAKVKKTVYYAEICFSADTQYYSMYKTLFEEKMRKSIEIDLEDR